MYVWHRWIADELRAAGLRVHEVQGWKNRGRPASTGAFDPKDGSTNHHTASTTSKADPHPTIRTLIEGRPDLPGPLCHVSVDFLGDVWVIAAGRANHAGRTDKSVPGVPAGADGNAHFLGDEIDTNGTQRISPEQRATVAVVNRVFTDHFKNHDDRIHRHADLTVRKWDIGSITTAVLRSDAAAVNTKDWFDMATAKELQDAIRKTPLTLLVGADNHPAEVTLEDFAKDTDQTLEKVVRQVAALDAKVVTLTEQVTALAAAVTKAISGG